MNTKFTSRFNILYTYRTATKSKHYSYRTENRFKSVLHFDRLVDNTVITLSGIHEERKTKDESRGTGTLVEAEAGTEAVEAS